MRFFQTVAPTSVMNTDSIGQYLRGSPIKNRLCVMGTIATLAVFIIRTPNKIKTKILKNYLLRQQVRMWLEAS